MTDWLRIGRRIGAAAADRAVCYASWVSAGRFAFLLSLAACTGGAPRPTPPVTGPLTGPLASASGSTTAPASPPTVEELVATDDQTFCARRSDGTVRCWGRGAELQLGDGEIADASRPVVAKVSDSRKLVAGPHSVCSIDGGGGVTCWGGRLSMARQLRPESRGPAKLGGGASEVAFTTRGVCLRVGEGFRCLRPTEVPGPSGAAPGLEWKADPVTPSLPMTTAPTRHPRWALAEPDGTGVNWVTCGLVAGQVSCRGANFDGLLGNGKDTGVETTAATVQGLSGVVQLTEASLAQCALRNDGTVACWGQNHEGALGFAPDAKLCAENHVGCTRLPTTVPGLTNVVEIGRPNPLCARRADGEVHCLGFHDGAVRARKIALPAGATQLATTLAAACALLADRSVHCWGDDGSGQLGRGRILSSDTPVQVPPLADVVQVDGGTYGVALRKDGTLVTFGAERPKKAVKLTEVVSIAGRCALRKDATVWCWGNNADGLLGDGKRTRPPGEDEADPRKVPGVSDVVQLASDGSFAACALRKDGAVLCWGDNLLADVPGYPELGPLPKPVKVAGIPKLRAIAMGYGLDEAGAVWAWARWQRVKGKPARLDAPKVTRLSGHAPGAGSRWGAGKNGCFVTEAGGVHCDGPDPVVAGLGDVVALAARARPLGCALRKDGVVLCWTYAEGTPGAKDVVTQRLTEVEQLAGTGDTGWCAVRRDHTVWCWGSNTTGLVGPDVALHDAPPAPVVGL